MNVGEQSNPSEVARETIRQLVQRRIVPTPDNYARVYSEIGGGAKGNPAAPARSDVPNWAVLIRGLLRGLEARHATLSVARKRESFEKVLNANVGDPNKLHARLAGLVKSWLEEPLESAVPIETIGSDGPSRSAREVVLESISVASERDAARAVRELLAATLEFGIVERLGYSPGLIADARSLAARARIASTPAALEQYATELKQFWLRLELEGESQAELMQGMQGLMASLLNNVGELVADDRWLHGQLESIRTLLAKPLESRSLRDVEIRFREVVYKQGTIKHGLDQAKSAFKEMLATFIDRMGAAVTNTGDFHDRIGNHVERIKEVEDISQLSEIIEQVMSDTRGIQSDMLRTRDELQNSREQVHEYEQRIVNLKQELDAVSALVREDPLTHALNRRGFSEAWAVEVARSERRKLPLCLSVLDLDNFKMLNDRLGHVVGDEALVHLTAVVRAELRPADVVARYGGEEFVIMLPESRLDEAVNVMTRVQRKLTRRFFLHQNEKVLITFSAGVIERKAGESEQDAVARADQALYEAKRTGKNRVVAG